MPTVVELPFFPVINCAEQRLHVVHELLKKYKQIIDLREQVTNIPCPPQVAMRNLAQQFPGALRELDQIPPEALAARHHHLRQWRNGTTDDWQPWVELTFLYHQLWRGALHRKQWLQNRSSKDFEQTSQLYQTYLQTLPEDHDALVWKSNLRRLNSSPPNRLSTIILEQLAEQYGWTNATVKTLLFSYLWHFSDNTSFVMYPQTFSTFFVTKSSSAT
jgi:hypothetical protein